jgi:hypothetical protein
MEDAAKNKLREIWDRPALLLIAQPREDWEPEFKQITRRERDLGRLALQGPKQGRDE